jgi:hypothetical protein
VHSVLKTETAVYFETLVITYESGWHRNVDHRLNCNHLKNFKSRICSELIFLLIISYHLAWLPKLSPALNKLYCIEETRCPGKYIFVGVKTLVMIVSEI